MSQKLPVIVRGGGDLATGTIYRLFRAGFPVIVLETEKPAAIRRSVAFCQAVYDGTMTVEGVTARLVETAEEAFAMCDGAAYLSEPLSGNNTGDDQVIPEQRPEIPVLIDPECACLAAYKAHYGRRPQLLVDLILAKRNLGTGPEMADTVIGVGPGFTARARALKTGAVGTGSMEETQPFAYYDVTVPAGEPDCDYIIETKRGHRLGRIISDGSAIPNTGIPGMICGVGIERVMHAPATGVIHNLCRIGDIVRKGDVLAEIVSTTEQIAMDDAWEGHAYVKDDLDTAISCRREENGMIVTPLLASINGCLRGIIVDGYEVHKGLKAADIDPREQERDNCFTISDKARAIAGSVLELAFVRIDSKADKQ